ncbi:hypothetical protein N566_07645 [Streptomycetaceae bacterium MP113-05]|nr:hypothetical protein N566_07645 [Streptomycetaceae bacterium MP113-05]
MGAHRRDEGGEKRVAGGPVASAAGGPEGHVEHTVEVGLERFEQGDLVPGLLRADAQQRRVVPTGHQVAVADVVHQPGVAVDGQEVTPPCPRQHHRGHREVLVRGLVENGARVHVRLPGHCGLP